MILSICIATFNRSKYLKESLQSIVGQFDDPEVAKNVNVYVLDNISEDNTKEVVLKFVDHFENIVLIEDNKRRDMAKGIVKSASLGDGNYLWVFSDDDLMIAGCLKKIITVLQKTPADLLLLNIDSFVEKNRTHRTNLFKESENRYFNNRREFWLYLNTKFYYDIDYFTTYCSNWILKKNYFDKTKQLFEIYNKKLDLFPFPSLVFYSDLDFSAQIIAESLVMFRADNASWVRKNPICNFFYSDSLWRHHYNLIVSTNREFLPLGFAFKVSIKNLLRIKDLLFLFLVLILKKIGLFNFVGNLYKKIRFK
jgi:glycosyltransferase involved in cell wall biosynthesis